MLLYEQRGFRDGKGSCNEQMLQRKGNVVQLMRTRNGAQCTQTNSTQAHETSTSHAYTQHV